MKLAIAVLAATLVAAAPASAHVGVKSFSPGRGASVPRSLEVVKVTFKAKITDGKLTVRNANGTKVSKGEGSVINKQHAVRTRLDGGLSKGRYKATYSVLNTDGHVITKSWNFNLK
jgi:methionine-rich copper-binding protein CopC